MFAERFDRSIVFLWGGWVSDIEADDATDLLEDKAERRWQIAACVEVTPYTAADVTRREFEAQANVFDVLQLMRTLNQSFTLDALKKRYHYQESRGSQEVTDGQSDGAADGAGGDEDADGGGDGGGGKDDGGGKDGGDGRDGGDK